jgi:4-diphosphocytidyl-2-C-methyl-D-erythritol kinase
MMNSLTAQKAYAKVNLHLEVLNTRADGYHNIFSVMAAVGLYDLLKPVVLEINENSAHDVRIIAVGGAQAGVFDDLPVEKNIIYKAVKSYFEGTGFSCRAVFEVEKNIPAGGGLGGGSSDGAAALRILNSKFSLHDESSLLLRAAKVGADVPFCLGGGLAFCEGIGEIVSQKDIDMPHKVLVVNNGVHVNTKTAYQMIDDSREKAAPAKKEEGKSGRFEALLKENRGIEFKKHFFNDFEPPVFTEFNSVKQLKERMYAYGASFSIMTGSGSSVIGLFDNTDLAETARNGFSDIQQVILTDFVGIIK